MSNVSTDVACLISLFSLILQLAPMSSEAAIPLSSRQVRLIFLLYPADIRERLLYLRQMSRDNDKVAKSEKGEIKTTRC